MQKWLISLALEKCIYVGAQSAYQIQTSNPREAVSYSVMAKDSCHLDVKLKVKDWNVFAKSVISLYPNNMI